MSAISVDQIISESFALTKKNFWRLVMFGGAIISLSLVPQIVQFFLKFSFGENSPAYTILSLVITIFAVLWLQPVLQLGITKIYLDFIDGNQPVISDVFSLKHLWLRCFGASILVGLIVIGLFAGLSLLAAFAYYIGNTISSQMGMALMALSGLVGLLAFVYVSVRYMFYIFFIADKKTGAIESIKSSWVMTKGSVRTLVILSIILMLINLVGLMLLGLGLLFTAPMSYMAQTLAYRKISGK